MSADHLNRNVIEFARPVLVTVTPVFDLSASRQKKLEQQDQLADGQNNCADGVCVLSWRPRKPHGDVA